jgi:hypothetical protein
MKKILIGLAAIVAVYASLSIVPHSLIGETPWRSASP